MDATIHPCHCCCRRSPRRACRGAGRRRRHRRQVGAAPVGLGRRPAPLRVAGVDRAHGLQHAQRQLPAGAAGAPVVLAQIRLVADALFDLLPRRLRHPRLLRDLASRPPGLARLHPPASGQRRGAVSSGGGATAATPASSSPATARSRSSRARRTIARRRCIATPSSANGAATATSRKSSIPATRARRAGAERGVSAARTRRRG